MEWFEHEVRDLEHRVVNKHAATVNGSRPLAFYGSSSIRLWTTLEEDFAGRTVLNLGFGGSSMTACSWFFWRLIRPVSPSALVLYAGDNDLAEGCSPQAVLAQFRHLAFQLAMVNRSTPIGLLSIKISPCRLSIRRQIERTNELMQAEMSRWPCLFVDITEPMLDRDGQPDTSLFLPDGMHLSSEGYRVWARVLREKIGFLATPMSGLDCFGPLYD